MNRVVKSISTVLLTSSLLWAQSGDEIIGKYRLPNQLDVEVYKLNEKYFGKIIGFGTLDDEHQIDVNNPDKALRNEPLLGKIIIKNLEYDPAESEWVNGKMYGPEKGLIFNLKITEVRKNEIEVIGSKYFFWKTLTWDKL